MAEFKMTLQDLYDQLSGLDRYTPEDDATLRQRAIDIYSPQYQADLQRLRDQIEFQVDRQQRNAVKTGMQRSSYNQAQQASIRRGGLQSEASLSGAYEGNVANMYYNMLEREKDRKDAADQYRNQLLLQLYGMQPKGGGKAQEDDTADDSPTLNFTSTWNRRYVYPEISLTPQRDINQGVNSLTMGNTLGGSTTNTPLARQYKKTRPTIEDANRKLTLPNLNYGMR